MKYLAIDIGGTNLKFGFVSLEGMLLQHWTVSVPSNYNDLIQKISDIYNSSKDIIGVGVSSPGIYDQKNDMITGSSALEYLIDKPLKKDLSRALNTTIMIENDGNCALLGEYWKGNCKNSRLSAIYVIGSAIGGSIQIDGHILRGAHNNAGELGYSLVDNQPSSNSFGSLGGKVGFNALLKKGSMGGFYCKNGKELLCKAKFNIELEQLIVSELKYLALSFITMQYVIDPEVILVGGGVSQNSYFMDLLLVALRKVQDTRPNYKVYPTVLPAKFGNNSNLLGAVYKFLNDKKRSNL